MKILLIGAGAVGQVYGYHFLRGGADVSVFVREKYADAARHGFDLYPLNRKKAREAPVRFEGFDVLTDMAEATAQRWDVVVLCLSSTALRSGTWFAELAAGLGDATLVSLTPGIEDYALITERVPEGQVVSGMIGLSSYPGPLEGGSLPTPGMVYWVPPFTKMAFSGPRERTDAVVSTLTAGGLKSKRVADVQATAAFGGPVLQFQMVAMELTGWTFAGLRADKPLMTLTHKATREALDGASKRLGKKIPFAMRLLRPWVMRLVTRVARRAAPFDIERFFHKHFAKVGDQTELALETRIRIAHEQGTGSDAIVQLRDRLLAHRRVG